MTANEIFELINKNPVFHLATMDGDQPRVRGMLLFRADKNGFVFHTASTKDVFRQIMANPKAEMCFSCGNVQIRVTGAGFLTRTLHSVRKYSHIRQENFFRHGKQTA